jgi:hypothetical protein
MDGTILYYRFYGYDRQQSDGAVFYLLECVSTWGIVKKAVEWMDVVSKSRRVWNHQIN